MKNNNIDSTVSNKETKTQEGGERTPEYPEGKIAVKANSKSNQDHPHRKRNGLGQREEGNSSDNPPQGARHTTQNEPKPKRNKTEDINLSDQEVEHRTQSKADEPQRRRREQKTHAQRNEETQIPPPLIGGPMPGPPG